MCVIAFGVAILNKILVFFSKARKEKRMNGMGKSALPFLNRFFANNFECP